jgi:dTDP-4-dehydrorhamnose 3,5-epimerase
MNSESKASILDKTLAAAVRDAASVTPEGVTVKRVTEGVRFRASTTHTDARGTVMELYDLRWNWHPEPLVFAYSFTIRPGVVKGWNLHRKHEDRYMLLQGELLTVLYDPRPDSSTYGEVCEIAVSEHERRLVSIPRNVWHADHNIGNKDVVVVNFPTMAYDHNDPDKYRLPLGTTLIPYRFPPGTFGW